MECEEQTWLELGHFRRKKERCVLARVPAGRPRPRVHRPLHLGHCISSRQCERARARRRAPCGAAPSPPELATRRRVANRRPCSRNGSQQEEHMRALELGFSRPRPRVPAAVSWPRRPEQVDRACRCARAGPNGAACSVGSSRSAGRKAESMSSKAYTTCSMGKGGYVYCYWYSFSTVS